MLNYADKMVEYDKQTLYCIIFFFI